MNQGTRLGISENVEMFYSIISKRHIYLYIATFLHLDKMDLIATHPNGYGLTLRKSSAFRTETEHDIVLVQCQKKRRVLFCCRFHHISIFGCQVHETLSF